MSNSTSAFHLSGLYSLQRSSLLREAWMFHSCLFAGPLVSSDHTRPYPAPNPRVCFLWKTNRFRTRWEAKASQYTCYVLFFVLFSHFFLFTSSPLLSCRPEWARQKERKKTKTKRGDQENLKADVKLREKWKRNMTIDVKSREKEPFLFARDRGEYKVYS